MQACPKDRQREEISSVKTLYQGGSGEIVEKKSRFIATTEKIETEEEALAFIGRMKKQRSEEHTSEL